jgi:hypothetical protein
MFSYTRYNVISSKTEIVLIDFFFFATDLLNFHYIVFDVIGFLISRFIFGYFDFDHQLILIGMIELYLLFLIIPFNDHFIDLFIKVIFLS